MTAEYPFHPKANDYELLTGDELAELAEDIKENGLLSPVELWHGWIVDGRNRYNACRQAGVECRFEVLDHLSEDDILARIESRNDRRRHESAETRRQRRQDRDARIVAAREQGLSLRQIATREKVSLGTVQRAFARAGVSPDTPGREVAGTDGKTYPVRRSSPVPDPKTQPQEYALFAQLRGDSLRTIAGAVGKSKDTVAKWLKVDSEPEKVDSGDNLSEEADCAVQEPESWEADCAAPQPADDTDDEASEVEVEIPTEAPAAPVAESMRPRFPAVPRDGWGIPIQPHAQAAFNDRPLFDAVLKKLRECARELSDLAERPGGKHLIVGMQWVRSRTAKAGEDAGRYVLAALENAITHVAAARPHVTDCPYAFNAERPHDEPSDADYPTRPCQLCRGVRWLGSPRAHQIPPQLTAVMKAHYGIAAESGEAGEAETGTEPTGPGGREGV